MMNMRVYLEILGDDGTATRTFAKLAIKPGLFAILEYREHAGAEATISTLNLREGGAMLSKKGACRAELSFNPLQKAVGSYDAGLGPWEAEVETLEYAAELKLDGSAIIRYKLRLSGQEMGERELRVKWRSKANSIE